MTELLFFKYVAIYFTGIAGVMVTIMLIEHLYDSFIKFNTFLSERKNKKRLAQLLVEKKAQEERARIAREAQEEQARIARENFLNQRFLRKKEEAK